MEGGGRGEAGSIEVIQQAKRWARQTRRSTVSVQASSSSIDFDS